MSKNYLIINLEIDAQNAINLFNENMGYPNEVTTSATVCRPTRDGRFGVLICPMCYPLLTEEQKLDLVSVPYFNQNLAVETVLE